MRPGSRSKTLLGSTRSKGKMYEYNVPDSYHIKLKGDPARLFPLSIGILGDIAEKINHSEFNYVLTEDDINSLLFSAHFLEAFYLSRLDPELDGHILSLIAASYYIASLPGSSLVYSKKLEINFQKNLFLSFLNAVFSDNITLDSIEAAKQIWPVIGDTLHLVGRFYESDQIIFSINSNIQYIRNFAYSFSAPINLLVIDIACAIIKLKINNSVWTVIPSSSDISKEMWHEVFKKDSFIKEVWPSQKILAEEGVFRGQSATVQMPTSAGKTKSTEIILRSYFFKNDTQSTVIVAPFKALCHEISDSLKECFQNEIIKVDEFTDVFQKDYSEKENKGNQVIVTTPEKLVYILRQDPSLSDGIGLLILDEGHQFDSGIRGVTYELLITTLKQILPIETQKVLISAVLSNSESIDNWLNGNNGRVVSGSRLSPTQKTIGFVNWSTALGRIEYVQNPNIDEEDFFVPRVIDKTLLNRKKYERSKKYFPQKDNGSSIALHLGLSLVSNGCVAIFCGVKTTVVKTCDLLVDIHSRSYECSYPNTVSEQDELDKLSNLYFQHLGSESSEGTAAGLGVLTHHASLPHGLRLAIEYALREEKARFVICTSTLAQGVNLPIRYLMFTNIYQAGEKLTVRDFHNLVGRAGRSGMHTEGTILFTNPEVYEKRKSRDDGWRWELIKDILRPENSEPCSSSLLGIFDKIKNNAKKQKDKLELTAPTIEFLRAMISDPRQKDKIVAEIVQNLATKGFDEKTVSRQFDYKEKIINSIEGYLLANLPEGQSEDIESQFLKELTMETLAFHLASDEQKEWLIELFELIASSLNSRLPESKTRATYSRTLLGIEETKLIDSWLDDNMELLFDNYENIENLLTVLWPLIYMILPHSNLKKLNKRSAPLKIALEWIKGTPYWNILDFLESENCHIKAGSTKRYPTVQHVVDMTEGSIAFDGMLILGAVIELVLARDGMEDTLIPDALRHLQKSIKYGLPNQEEIKLYEMGFPDRRVAKDIASIFIQRESKVLKRFFIEYSTEIEDILINYPSYFTFQYETIKLTLNKG